MTWADWAEESNAKARAKGRWRELRVLDAFGPRGVVRDGRALVSFASNDYLGLSAHPNVLQAAHEAIDRWGTGAGSARLLSGSRPVHSDLERALAEWKSTEAALVFPTGFSANVGALSALAGPRLLICSDAYNHASIIDGCRLARSLGAHVETYPHGDVDAVSALLGLSLERPARAAPSLGAPPLARAVVVTDSVFSMDGDVAPIGELAERCAEHGALLVLDEAHGVLGPDVMELPCETLRIGTLSKTLGSQGGFVAGPRVLIEMLVNRCRSFIFTTALAPASAAAAKAALEVLRSVEGEQLLARLRGHALRLRPGTPVPSPIVPVIIGDEEAALEASSAMARRGLFVPAARPPTVPPGSSRLRVTLSAAHTDAELDMLVRALDDLGLKTTSA